jgi:hypothetical protein
VVNVIKLFNLLKYARVFEPGMYFLSSLIFVGKVWSLHIECEIVRCSTLSSLGLPYIFIARLEKLAKEKCSGLFGKLVSYKDIVSNIDITYQ